MFTGIVESTAEVVSLTEKSAAWLLLLRVPREISDSLALGDSLACNGCCLTVISNEGGVVGFELLEETLRRTSFEGLLSGDVVNVERPLKADARLGGHFVTGHVDVRQKVEVFSKRGKNFYLKVSVPAEFSRYAVYKGSIAIDGISLTVAEAESDALAVWLIPHTLEVTNLKNCKEGAFVNLEFDILAKYVEKISVGAREKSSYQP